jgi:hypothetical protein
LSQHNDDPMHVFEREAVVPPQLRGRITQSLRDRGLLRSTRPARRRIWLTAGAMAAATLLFATGFGIGRRSVEPAADTRPSFMLLLYEGRDFRLGPSLAAAEAEYDAWADSVQKGGAGVLGRALVHTTQLLRNTPQGVRVESEAADAASAQGMIDGFFILRVTDEAEAVTIARTHPHLRHGGWIVLRPIKPAS